MTKIFCEERPFTACDGQSMISLSQAINELYRAKIADSFLTAVENDFMNFE
jgi:hypothetical protein